VLVKIDFTVAITSINPTGSKHRDTVGTHGSGHYRSDHGRWGLVGGKSPAIGKNVVNVKLERVR
jgi:hypothetical protein